MKLLLVLSLFAIALTACEPSPAPADGLDSATDAVQAPDASPEASADTLPPHVDGGGID